MTDLKETIAENIRKLMEKSEDCKSANALGEKSGVGQTTVSNYLRYQEYGGWPKLDKLQMIANCFGIETWMLLHPTMGDKDLSAKEIQLYRRWREEFKTLQDQ